MLTRSSDGTEWSSEPVVVPGLVEGMQATVADLTLAGGKARLLCTLSIDWTPFTSTSTSPWRERAGTREDAPFRPAT